MQPGRHFGQGLLYTHGTRENVRALNRTKDACMCDTQHNTIVPEDTAMSPLSETGL